VASRGETSPPRAASSFCALRAGGYRRTCWRTSSAEAHGALGFRRRVSAHTLRHTAATWLRQETGDTRLVAEYLGHSDLSTVSRFAHVAAEEMHAAVQSLGGRLYGDVDENPDLRAAA